MVQINLYMKTPAGMQMTRTTDFLKDYPDFRNTPPELSQAGTALQQISQTTTSNLK